MEATDYLIRVAQAEQAINQGDLVHKGFTIKTWNIDGYGWVGEVRDSGYNLYPNWMNANQGFKMRFQAVEFMQKRIDEYLEKVNQQ